MGLNVGTLNVYWVFLTSGVQEESVDCAVIFSSQLDLIPLIWLGQVDPAWKRIGQISISWLQQTTSNRRWVYIYF